MAPHQRNNFISITAVVVSIAVGLMTLLGMPKCYDFQTKAEASVERANTQKQIDRIESKLDRMLDIMLKKR